MTIDLFAAGGVLIDCIVEADGTVRLGRVGGNAAYAAAGARIAGATPGIVGRVPADYPAAALDELATRGLDVAGVARVAAETAAPEWFFHRADGGRADHLHASIAAFEGAFGRVERLTREQAQAWRRRLEAGRDESGFAAFRARHPVRIADVPGSWWSARGMHIGANAAPEMLALAREGRRRDMIISCDPGFRASDLSGGELVELLGLVDAFLPSEKELAALRPGQPAEAAVETLASRARGIVVAKLGAGGALLRASGERASRRIAAAAARATDPTGAGDCFGGALLAGLAVGLAPEDAARQAAVAASIAVETSGVPALIDAGRIGFARRLAAAGG